MLRVNQVPPKTKNSTRSSYSMDELPPSLILEILSRLSDSTDLARCRVASKTLNSLSREVRSINLLCTLSRYLKSRSPETMASVTPFKTIFKNLVRDVRVLDSVSMGVDKSLTEISYDDADDESNDLYLCDVRFVEEWLPGVSGELRSLSILDFWFQSCWRKSEVLCLISSCCRSLVELELKNAWLSVDGLKQMHTLTNLTLEFVRLEDEDLNKVNDCFPSLQVLSLVGVGGLRDPKIHLLHLKSCVWTVSNAPLSLSIFAPNLVILKLKCIRPKLLVLETPMLSDFYLSLEKADEFRAKEFCNLKSLQFESLSLCRLFDMFASGEAIKRLMVDSPKGAESLEKAGFGLEVFFDMFPNVSSLTLGPGAWSEAENYFSKEGPGSRTEMKALEEIVAHLVIYNIDVTLSFIYSILNKCTNLSDMALLIHCEEDPCTASSLISRCTNDRPRIRWRWGMWKEGSKPTWVSNGI